MPPPPFTGYLHLQYISHPPPVWHHSISLFRPSAFPLGVVGISICTSSTSLHELLDDFNSRVAQLYPHGSPYPLAKICFAFEEGSEHIHLNTADNGVEVIPNVLGGNKKVQHIGMLLAGLCSHILASFSILVRTYSHAHLLLTRTTCSRKPWNHLVASKHYTQQSSHHILWTMIEVHPMAELLSLASLLTHQMEHLSHRPQQILRFPTPTSLLHETLAW